jgi:hypothetical protein
LRQQAATSPRRAKRPRVPAMRSIAGRAAKGAVRRSRSVRRRGGPPLG